MRLLSQINLKFLGDKDCGLGVKPYINQTMDHKAPATPVAKRDKGSYPLTRWHKRGQVRQGFRCPCCGHSHKRFVEAANLLRWRGPHHGPTFSRPYRQRTLVERAFALADAYKLTRQRCCRSVAHRNTLIASS